MRLQPRMSNSGSTTAALLASCVPTRGLMVALAARRTSFTNTLSQSCASALRCEGRAAASSPAAPSRRAAARWAAASACASFRSCRQYLSSSVGSTEMASHSNITVCLSSSLLAARLPRRKDSRRTRGAAPACACRHRTTCRMCETSCSKASHGRSCVDSFPRMREMLTCSSSLEVYILDTRVRSESMPISTKCVCLFEDEHTRFRRRAVTWMRSWTSLELPMRLSDRISACRTGSTPRLARYRWLSSLLVRFFRVPTTKILRSVAAQWSSEEASRLSSRSRRPPSRNWASREESLLSLKSALATLRYAAATP
mmetsp:Transcript_19247/g.61122  ORF Transcript_19247/g.61122 Transcript_19247/m.61122 type:complete len:313 (+) Transcript_19247:711-1649(+)